MANKENDRKDDTDENVNLMKNWAPELSSEKVKEAFESILTDFQVRSELDQKLIQGIYQVSRKKKQTEQQRSPAPIALKPKSLQKEPSTSEISQDDQSISNANSTLTKAKDRRLL